MAYNFRFLKKIFFFLDMIWLFEKPEIAGS